MNMSNEFSFTNASTNMIKFKMRNHFVVDFFS